MDRLGTRMEVAWLRGNRGDLRFWLDTRARVSWGLEQDPQQRSLDSLAALCADMPQVRKALCPHGRGTVGLSAQNSERAAGGLGRSKA